MRIFLAAPVIFRPTTFLSHSALSCYELFGNSFSLYNLSSKPCVVVRLLGLHGLPPCHNPSKVVGKRQQIQQLVLSSSREFYCFIIERTRVRSTITNPQDSSFAFFAMPQQNTHIPTYQSKKSNLLSTILFPLRCMSLPNKHWHP